MPFYDKIHFPDGLLGFPRVTDFQLTTHNNIFWSLRSPTGRDAWVLVEASLWLPNLQIKISDEDISDFDDCFMFLVVNRHDGCLTVNTRGPLLINQKTLQGCQVINYCPEADVKSLLCVAPSDTEGEG